MGQQSEGEDSVPLLYLGETPHGCTQVWGPQKNRDYTLGVGFISSRSRDPTKKLFCSGFLGPAFSQEGEARTSIKSFSTDV